MSGSTSKRYPAELRERAVRMVGEIRSDHGSEWAAMCKVAELLGIGTPETVRKWCRLERLMTELGLWGAVRVKVKRTTISDPRTPKPLDLVARNFRPLAPDRSSHPSKPNGLTTLTTRHRQPSESHTRNSPDSPGRFSYRTAD